MKTILILVRHGETETNIKGKLHLVKDLQILNETGRVQIQKTAKVLLKYKPTALYSSKAPRATKSAEIISKVCKVSAKTITGLQERNWGDYSGKSWSEITKLIEKMTPEETYTFVPPNGESWKSFTTRLKKAINQLIARHKGETMVVITHGGVIRALLPHLLDIPEEERFKYKPVNASITIFEHAHNRFKKINVNDFSHLLPD